MPDIQTEAEQHLAKLEKAKEEIEDEIFDIKGDVDQALEDVNYAERNRDDWDTQDSFDEYVSRARERLKHYRTRLADWEGRKAKTNEMILKMMDVIRHAKLRRN